jgi:hypothetical protein
MPLSRTITYRHASALSDVYALLCDRDYLHQRCVADGGRNVTVEVREHADGVDQTLARDRNIELPPFVRGLIRPTNYTVETIAWRRDEHGYRAAYRVGAKTMPGTVCGELTLRALGAGTHYEATFEVDVHVPLIARKLEALMANGFAAYLQANAEHDARALRGPHETAERYRRVASYTAIARTPVST